MMHLQLLVLSLAALSILRHTEGLRFIAAPLSGSNSPAMDIMGVASHLQSRGHEVMVVVTDDAVDFIKAAAARHTSNTTAEALQVATFDSASSFDRGLRAIMESVGDKFKSRSKMDSLKLVVTLQEVLSRPCAAILADTALMQRLRSFKADGVMAVGLALCTAGDGCTCVLAHALGVPAINVNGNPLFFGPPNVPQFGSGLTPADLRTWHGWLKNHLVWAAKQLLPDLLLELGGNPWSKLRRNAGLPRVLSPCWITNGIAWLRGEREARTCDNVVEVILQNWLLEYPRPLTAHQVLVGPGSPRPAHPALDPPEVASFVEGATDGVVLVAFGTTPQSAITMNATDFTELSAAFAALAPVRVLWAMKAHKALPSGLTVQDLNLADNTLLVPWVEYNDVLGHPKLRAFVSHCGIHSMWEAAYHGVPLIAVPFQFEQAENAAKVAAHGSGVLCRQAPAFRVGKDADVHYTRDYVAALIKQVLDDPGFASAASGMSAALQSYAASRHPYARAADEVELAINSLHVQQQDSAAGRAEAPGGRDEL